MNNIKDVFDTRMVPAVHDRKSGNSTRQIDAAIQALFNGKIVKVVDHADDGDNRATSFLFKAIIRRLEYEHNLEIMYKFGQILVNKRDYTIKLTEQYYISRKYAEEHYARENEFYYNKFTILFFWCQGFSII